VFESRAIARYIAAKAGSPLLPTGDAHKAALFEQAVSVEASNFDPFASGITSQRVFAPMFGRKTDEARVTELATTLEGKMAGYEAILAKHRYLAGDELTLADLFHLPYGSFLAPQKFGFLEDEVKYPNVARYAFLRLARCTVPDLDTIAGGRRSRPAHRGRRSRTAFPREGTNMSPELSQRWTARYLSHLNSL
jgi:glutathione S-transferase